MWLLVLGGEDPLEKEMEPTPVFLPGKLHGQRSQQATVNRVAKQSDNNSSMPSMRQANGHHAFSVSQETEVRESTSGRWAVSGHRHAQLNPVPTLLWTPLGEYLNTCLLNSPVIHAHPHVEMCSRTQPAPSPWDLPRLSIEDVPCACASNF